MKKTKFWIAVILCFGVLFAACSGGKEEGAAGNAGGSGDNAAKTAEGDGASAPKEEAGQPADDQNKIQFPLAEPVTISIFGRSHSASNKPNGELKVFQDLEKKTNVLIDWDSVPDQQLIERKNLIFASNEMPDAFYGLGMLSNEEVVRFGSQGFLMPLEDLIDEYAPNLLQVFETRPELRNKITAPDGHIYSLPLLHEANFFLSPPALFINKAWLDQLGRDIPKTTEEFYEVLKAFRDNDMNGNGQQDEIPLSFGNNNISGPYALSGSFGIMDRPFTHLYIDNGQVKFVPAEEGYKEYVKYLHRLYSEGLIDREVFTHDANVYQAKLRSEEPIVGAFLGWMLSTVFGDSETDYVAIPPLQGPDGHALWMRGNFDESLGAFAVSSTNKHPEITIAWVDQIYEETTSIEHTWGPIGHNLQRNADGNYEFLPIPEGMGYGAFRHSETTGAAGLHIMTLERSVKIIQGPQKEKMDIVDIYLPYLEEEIYPNVLMSEEDGKTLSRIQSEMTTQNGYIDSTFAKWVVGGKIDEEWDRHLDQLQRLGLEELLDIYQRYYDAVMK